MIYQDNCLNSLKTSVLIITEKYLKTNVLINEDKGILMRLEKHQESLKEVLDEINTALEDSRGLISHQGRLAMMLPIGNCELIELYFHELGIIKEGSRIKYDWFKQKRIKEKLENQIINPIDQVTKIDSILFLATSIEEKRDDLAYGSPVQEETLLMEKINQFFELKKIIEKEVGGLIETK